MLQSATFPLTCTQTPLCVIHSSKFIKVYTISNINSNDCTIFTPFFSGVLIASSLFKHFKEMETKLCKIQGILVFLVLIGSWKASEISLAYLQSDRKTLRDSK